MAIEPIRRDTDAAQLPPHNPDAEAAVLGSVLLDREVLSRVSATLTPRDFYSTRNSLIYQAMLDLDGRDTRVDYLTLVDELERTGQLASAGTATYVANLIGVVPTPIHAEQYAQRVADAAVMRRMISVGARLAAIGFANQLRPEQAIEQAELLLSSVDPARTSAEFVSMVEGLSAYLDQLGLISDAKGAASPTTYTLPTTYRDLDGLLGGGLSRGSLTLLAGRPGMGKSSLMLEIMARSALLYKIRVALFSPEMSVNELLARVVSTTSGIPLATLATARLSEGQQKAFSSTLGRLAKLAAVMFDDGGTLTLTNLRAKVRRLAARGDLDLVVVDHLQLVSARSENRVAEIGEISRGLKAMAREYNIAVLALSQLSRAVEQRVDRVPQLADLRDSGTLEQDADVVLLLFREEYYKPETERAGVADLQVAKNRNGRTGKLQLIWNAETTGFRGLESYDGSPMQTAPLEFE